LGENREAQGGKKKVKNPKEGLPWKDSKKKKVP